MKKTTKISLAAIQGKLSRAEMKNIMAGSGSGCDLACCCNSCQFADGGIGVCRMANNGKVYCASGTC